MLQTNSFFLRMLFLVLAALAGVRGAGAAELGEARVLSTSGQPLRAEIELSGAGDLDPARLTVRQAAPDIYRQANLTPDPALAGLHLTVQQRDGRVLIVATSDAAVRASYLHLFLELPSSSGYSVRAITLWLPPAPPPPPPAAVAAAPAPVRTAAPAPAAGHGARPQAMLTDDPAPARPRRSSATPAHGAKPASTDGAHTAAGAETPAAAPAKSVAAAPARPPAADPGANHGAAAPHAEAAAHPVATPAAHAAAPPHEAPKPVDKALDKPVEKTVDKHPAAAPVKVAAVRTEAACPAAPPQFSKEQIELCRTAISDNAAIAGQLRVLETRVDKLRKTMLAGASPEELKAAAALAHEADAPAAQAATAAPAARPSEGAAHASPVHASASATASVPAVSGIGLIRLNKLIEKKGDPNSWIWQIALPAVLGVIAVLGGALWLLKRRKKARGEADAPSETAKTTGKRGIFTSLKQFFSKIGRRKAKPAAPATPVEPE